MTRIAIVGLGSIGSKHVDTLLKMGYTDLVAVDPRPMPEEDRLPVVGELKEIDGWGTTHALICSPPDWHFWQAKCFLDIGVPTFIEKPMTGAASAARILRNMADANSTVLAVGYMERAHPIVIEARNWAILHQPTRGEFYCYWRATEKSYALNVLDESSHAIDTALFVMGKAVGAKRTGGVGVRASINLTHEEAWSQVTMDMDATPRRRIQMYGEGCHFSKDYGTTTDEWDACYQTELQAFLDGKPLCSGEDGLAVMEVLERVR